MPKRSPIPPWQARKAATAKGLRELPACEYTDGCEGKGMGLLAKLDPFRLVLACPQCAQRARMESVPIQPTPRSGT